MWAVPCFIMVTGALLLDIDKEISYKKLFGKYILRILSAILIFSMIFRIFDMFMDKERFTVWGIAQGLYKAATGTSWSHVWYLYLLVGLYLLLPFYKKIVKYSSEKELKYLLAVYLIFLSVLPMTSLWNFNVGFYIHVSTIYPFYLIAGYMMHQKVINLTKIQAISAFIISTAVIAVLTVIRWEQDVPTMEMLWGYSSILVVIQSLSMFSLFLKIKGTGKRFVEKLLIEIDKCSFGIYLIHMIFVRFFLRYQGFNPYENGGIFSFILIIAGILVVSHFCTWVLKRIPGMKKIL